VAFQLIDGNIKSRFVRFDERVHHAVWNDAAEPHSDSVKMLILTPAAKAEIHSMTGTNVKKTASRMIPTAIISKINSVDGSIIFLLKMYL
jgi:hypothetical protein